MIPTLERIARDIWAIRYRIPERIFWALVLVSVAVLLLAMPRGAALLSTVAALGIGVVGVVEWRRTKRRCRFSLVVPLFAEGAGAAGRAVEAQTLIVDHLRQHLADPMPKLVQPLKVAVSSAEDEFAAKLQRRLRARYVLHGRIAVGQDGGWSVYPRVLERAVKGVKHVDPFTKDVTPANPQFGPLVSSLVPSVGVRDEEFPLDFCRDLEAVMQGLAGLIAEAFGQHDDAIRLLDRGLSKAGTSTSHQIDALRVARAEALAELGRINRAIDDLQDRLDEPDASSELRRTLANLLNARARVDEADPDADPDLIALDREEAADVLRIALQDEKDPQRDMTAYNLSQLLPRGTPEHDALVDQLLRPQSSYRRLWYVRQLEAIRLWIQVEEARKEGDIASVRRFGKQSAKWYSRTLRARPRLQFLGIEPRWPFVHLRRHRSSPILYANTKDAHEAAGHKWRTRYFEWRFQRIRRSHLNLADKHLHNSKWNLAYAHFDWASYVGRHDGIEHRAKAAAACCCWKGGRKRDGEAMWERARDHHPDCVIGRAFLVEELEALGLDATVPGTEPTDIDGAVGYVAKKFPGWVWHTDGEFISPDEFARLESDARERESESDPSA